MDCKYQAIVVRDTSNDVSTSSQLDAQRTFLRRSSRSVLETLDPLVAQPRTALVGTPPMRDVVSSLFSTTHRAHQHPKTIPKVSPYRRFKRHRTFPIRSLNDFRHWWKKSRLLVRLAGCYEYCLDDMRWEQMGNLKFLHIGRKHNRLSWKNIQKGVKHAKRIGRGGPNRDFLKNVHPFTRSLRLVIAFWRAWEARVDSRFFEVLFAEALAFMGNREARYYARFICDWSAANFVFPLSAVTIDRHLPQHSRPVIILMGLIRAVLPFMSSFLGSRIGRQSTFAAYDAANHRWKPVQSIRSFDMKAGAYRPSDDDAELLDIAKKVAEAIGHGEDPEATRVKLLQEDIGFEVTGAGQGGYAVYRSAVASEYEGGVVILHVTPYGPSILDEMPRYIILERRAVWHPSTLRYILEGELSESMRSLVSTTSVKQSILDMAVSSPDASLSGFCYSGAFFSPQEWAALKDRYDRELTCYDQACKLMGKRSHTATALANDEVFPPTNLLSLKAFLRTGRKPKKKRRDNKRWRVVKNKEKELTEKLKELLSGKDKGKAPNGIILYFEGLDCAGKSSTGGLISSALERAGYSISMQQYNRPPTEEEKLHPWMDRFSLPVATAEKRHAALIWDRGPGGDFVFGSLRHLGAREKKERHREFRTFDMDCRRRGILFCKLMFVSDRDSISKTLGKRLAHRKIVRDLHTWLDANSIDHIRDGLDEIENHIDPSDFTAFNQYDGNLSCFTEFARNTDDVGHVGEQEKSTVGFDNPVSDVLLAWNSPGLHSQPLLVLPAFCAFLQWLVVSTHNRYLARLQLIKSFAAQVDAFLTDPRGRSATIDEVAGTFGCSAEEDFVDNTTSGLGGEEGWVCKKFSAKAVVLVCFLLWITESYFRHSWEFWSNILDFT